MVAHPLRITHLLHVVDGMPSRSPTRRAPAAPPEGVASIPVGGNQDDRHRGDTGFGPTKASTPVRATPIRRYLRSEVALLSPRRRTLNRSNSPNVAVPSGSTSLSMVPEQSRFALTACPDRANARIGTRRCGKPEVDPHDRPFEGANKHGRVRPDARTRRSVTEETVTRMAEAEGDTVAVDEPLLEVSTDKVDTEILRRSRAC